MIAPPFGRSGVYRDIADPPHPYDVARERALSQRFAGADWAFVRDSSALVIVEPSETDVRGERCVDVDGTPLALAVVCLQERRGQRDPYMVTKEFAELARDYRAAHIESDRYYSEVVWRVMADANIGWVASPTTREAIVQAYIRVRVALHQGRLLLPRECPRLKKQLKDVRSRALANGMTIDLGEEEGGGHSDLVSALVCAVDCAWRGIGREPDQRLTYPWTSWDGERSALPVLGPDDR